MADVNQRSAHTGMFRPGAGRPMNFDSNVQAIASAAHLRGVVLMRNDQVVGSLEAAQLCRQLRLAHETTRAEAEKHDHVERLANGIAVKLGARGAVQVSRLTWNLLLGYGTPKKRAQGAPRGLPALNTAPAARPTSARGGRK